jgi:hypothetical protein
MSRIGGRFDDEAKNIIVNRIGQGMDEGASRAYVPCRSFYYKAWS